MSALRLENSQGGRSRQRKAFKCHSEDMVTAHFTICSEHGFRARWVPQSLKVPSEDPSTSEMPPYRHLAYPSSSSS